MRAPAVGTLARTAHVATSVGRLGAVAALLALAAVGLTAEEAQRVRAAYVVMDVSAGG